MLAAGICPPGAARAQPAPDFYTDTMMPIEDIANYRQLMRDIIIGLSDYARGRNPEFAVIVSPGYNLLTWSEREADLADAHMPLGAFPPEDSIVPVDAPMRRYARAIDGLMFDTPYCNGGMMPRDRDTLRRDLGLALFGREDCPSDQTAQAAMTRGLRDGVPVFATGEAANMRATAREGAPMGVNPETVTAPAQARNFLYMTDAATFPSKQAWVTAMAESNYDLLVIDPFYRDRDPLTDEDVYALKFKKLGAKRLVYARVDLGTASDTRYYWDADWELRNPSWILALRENQPGRFAVQYWHPRWKAILGRHLAASMDLGFDGIVLEGADAYIRFEDMTPLR